MPELPPIYNSRILKTYIACLNANYPDVDIDEILTYANVNKYELEDPGHWFNQRQVDRFHEKVVALTGKEQIAREAGRFIVSSNASGPVKQSVVGLIRISSIYLLLAKIYPMLSRGAIAKSRKLAHNSVEIEVVPFKNVHESPHQCENKIGIFEAIPSVSTDKYAVVEHPQCIHRGDKTCRFIVKWEEPAHRRWRRYFFAASGATVVMGIVSYPFLTTAMWIGGVSASALAVMGLYLKSCVSKIQELTKTLQNQGSVAEDHVKEIDFRYQGALLVQKIGQATSTILDVNELAKVVLENIQHHLDFDRGLIMLADREQTQLVYAAGYGFDDAMVSLLTNTHFHLNNPDAKGIFIQVFNEQREFLVDDVKAMQGSFSQRSQQFAERIGSKSLICLPIVYEGHSLGILAVDNIITKRMLTKSDMNLLMGVAYQTAASIFSANAFRELQDSEERYRSLYENAPTAYLSINVEDASVVNCNAAAVRLLGYQRSQLIGSSLLHHVGPDKENQMRARYVHELLKNGQSVPNESLALSHSDGHLVMTNISLEPFKDSQGRVIEGRCIIIDTTEQRQLEEQLQYAERMETIGTMAGGVAHDLSNILSAIVSYPDLLLMDIAPDSPLHEPLKKIKSAGRRATAIVQDLLTLARRGVAVTDVIDINDIIEAYLKSPEYENLLAQHADLNVTLDLQSDMVPIKGSTVHLAKTLMNITLNAAEAMADGGTVHISTYKEYVKANDTRLKAQEGVHAVLSIADSGHGIAPEDLKQVFEPFFTKKVMGRSGTGLGMAIVWAAVQDHKGFVDIDSEIEKGTTVRLYFPATREKRATQQVPSVLMNELTGQGETVLVVDDDAEHRKIAALMLTRIGYQVEIADSGEAAINHVTQHKPDIVVLDMVMGSNLDGLATYREILDVRPNQKAIITSGYAPTDRVKSALELGVGAYLKKPYGFKEIGAALRLELDKE